MMVGIEPVYLHCCKGAPAQMKIKFGVGEFRLD
jgi:hypothetical protein